MGSLVAAQDTVNICFAGDRVYIQNMLEYLPESWVMGNFVNNQLVFDMPQYIGTYDNEYDIVLPIYLNGFDPETGILTRQVTLDFDPQTRIFSNQTMPLGFGINKTGYLNIQDMYNSELIPIESYLTGDVNNDGRVSIDDVTALINYLLSGNVSNINLAAANVNGDGRCSIEDVTALIEILLRS